MTASDDGRAGDRVRPPRGGNFASRVKWLGVAIGAVFLSVAMAALVAPLTASGDAPTVQIVTDATYGTVLADNAGLPLYTLKTDHNGKSTCTGSCLQAWPPLTVPSGGSPTAGPGVSAGALGTSVQSDGRNQVTYNGSPLYTFVSDTPDTVTGNNVAGFVVVQVQAQPTPTTTAPPGPTTTVAPPSGPPTGPTSAPTTTVAPTRTATSPGGATPAAGTSRSPSATAGSPSPPVQAAGTPSSPATAAAGGATAATAATGALAFTGPGDGLHLTLFAGLGATLFALVLLTLLRLSDQPTRSATRE